MAIRRPRKSVIVVAGGIPEGERHARALTTTLDDLGIEASYVGRVDDVERILIAVDEEGADAVEVYLGAPASIAFLRELLRALTEAGRREVSIVVHRVS